jgi:uncharacterized protein YrrD
MKKAQEIIGLPIITISNGMEVGKVKSVIINASKGAIDYVVVDSGIQVLSVQVIPSENILGIGEYALTIENEDAMKDISTVPEAVNLVKENIQITGTKILTKKGTLIGEVGDIYIDEEDSCKIAGLGYITDANNDKVRIIPRESVITFGKNLLVVEDDVESKLLDSAAQLTAGRDISGFEKKNLVSSNYLDNEEANEPIDEVLKSESITEADNGLTDSSENEIWTETADESSAEPEQDVNDTSDSTSDAAKLFEQKQRQYLNGKIATKTITDNQGNIIVSEGMVINDQIIDEAKRNGKLIELVMNNRA